MRRRARILRVFQALDLCRESLDLKLLEKKENMNTLKNETPLFAQPDKPTPEILSNHEEDSKYSL